MLEVQNERPFNHAPKSKERVKIWEKIADTLTKEWKVDVDTRQVRDRTAALLSSYRKEDQFERKASGIVPEFSTLKKILCDVANQQDDSPTHDHAAEKKKKEEKKALGVECRKRAMATYSETSSGKKTKLAPVLAFIHEKAKKDQELNPI